MRRASAVTAALLVAGLGVPLLAASASSASDLPGSRDHPAVPRYEGARIVCYDQKAFDRAAFVVRPLQNRPREEALAQADGRVTRIRYVAPVGRSGLEVFRNYQNFLREAGFTTVYACEERACGAIQGLTGWAQRGNSTPRYVAATRARDGLRVSVFVAGELAPAQYQRASGVELVVVEPRALEQKVQLVDAAGIARDMAQSGRAVLYAIQFDLDRATLRPESDPQLREIAAWLQRTRGRTLIVGHTDGKGAPAYNLDLSRRRAAAVVEALTRRFQVPAARLEAVGVGMAAPVASNRSEEGAARNRRVEIVEIVQ